ncbi:hypothetical protein [Streptomyces subrutilus]|uniref:hypothetical protein n=1 Tax=Streptomyces subrutilus TaxID=36818 RepID=UPI002E12524D|nr:beta-lactamase family protein [Streptomyces subrutilus]
MTPTRDQAEDIRALVEAADPGAVWAVGGPEDVHAASHEPHPHAAAPDAPHPSGPAAPHPSGPGESAELDVGGLAAVLALWPAIGSLVDEGALHLHTPLTGYGEDAAPGITAHHLLTHPDGTGALAHLAERLSGLSLAELAATRVWHPLGMTRTRFDGGTLRAPLADLARFARHLLAPTAAHTAPPGTGITPAWTAESLRIRTGELTPARGLLWHPAPHGVWAHHAALPGAAALWLAPRSMRWALLLPAAGHGPLRSAFREAVFAPLPAP